MHAKVVFFGEAPAWKYPFLHSPLRAQLFSHPTIKMSNEGIHRGISCTKGRVGTQRRLSGAIRKIQLDTATAVFVARKLVYQRNSCILTTNMGEIDAFYYHPNYWQHTPSSEWNSELFTSTFQRFDFRAWNNRVWRMKLYCLTRQTILRWFKLFFFLHIFSIAKRKKRYSSMIPSFWELYQIDSK